MAALTVAEIQHSCASRSHEKTRNLASLAGDLIGQDFIGMKLGDVNGSWTPSEPVGQQSVRSDGGPGEGSTGSAELKAEIIQRMLEPRSGTAQDGRVSQRTVRIEAGPAKPSRRGSTGEAGVEIPIEVSGFERVTGLRFTLDWSGGAFRFDGVSEPVLRGLSEED